MFLKITKRFNIKKTFTLLQIILLVSHPKSKTKNLPTNILYIIKLKSALIIFNNISNYYH